MSWISGIADKAEQFLVKIDENAAGKLQKKKTSNSTQDVILTEVTSVNTPTGSTFTPPQSPIKKLSSVQKVSSRMSTSQTKNEEDLIDFLNDNTNTSFSEKCFASVQPTQQTALLAIAVEVFERTGYLQGVCNETRNTNQNSDYGSQTEDEKQMLKNEVRVLNNELSLLLHRTRAAEKVSESFKTEVQDMEKTRQLLQDEKNELNRKLRNVEHLNSILVSEKEQLKDHSIETLQANEQILQLQKKIQTLQENQSTTTLRLESKEREYSMLDASCQLQQKEVDSLNQQMKELQTELDQYRVRAQRTLSDKESIISQLRASHSSTAVETSFHTELNQLREEREVLREELTETLAQLDTVRRRLAEVEHTLEKVRESAARTQHELQDRLAQEKHKKCIIEDDYRIQTQELQLVREEMSTQLSQLTGKLREREAELNHLRNQLSSRPSSPTSHLLPGELEMRLSSLTKTLIQKQTALEAATMECNQLRMQYEELEHKHRERVLVLQQSRVMTSANDTDDAKAQVPSFLMESPLDTGVARRVKRAYSSLDAVSIRTGVFLRRYPLARILVILYVVVLHLLVLLVLFSRTPDNAQK